MASTQTSCRICLNVESAEYERFLVDIFGSDEEEFPIVDALMSICNLQISRDDRYTKSICTECCARLHEAYNLRKLCLRSQQLLARAPKVTTSVQIKIEPLNVVEEYVLETSDEEFKEQWIEMDDTTPFDLEESTEKDNVREQVADREEYTEVVQEESEVVLEHPADQDDTDVVLELPADRIEAATVSLEQPTVVQPVPENRFLCCGCDAVFVNVNKLLKHLDSEHRAGKSYDPPLARVQCSACYAVFRNTTYFENHLSTKTGGVVLRICQHCDACFMFKAEYQSHRKECMKTIKCCWCDFKSNRKADINTHLYTHKDHKPEIVGRFRCSICSNRFNSRTELHSHVRYDANMKVTPKTGTPIIYDPTLISCCGCNKVYNTAEELTEHQETIHKPQASVSLEPVPGAVECAGCYKTFPNQGALSFHKKIRFRSFACNKCETTRKTLEQLREHLLSHELPKSFLCCGCRMKFDTQEELEQHGREVHYKIPKMYFDIDNVEEKRPFQCQVCFRRYADERSMRNHQQYVYRPQKHMCDVCGKRFHSKIQCDIHMASHKETAECPCSLCGTKFKHPAQALACEKRHAACTKKNICSVCNVSFAKRESLISHMISHRKDRCFKCDVCGQAFKGNNALRAHNRRIHQNLRNYACTYCDARYSNFSSLDKHLIKHTGIYAYQCDICGKGIHSRNIFINHYESHVDEAQKVFKCHLCEDRFSKDHFLSNHIKFKHHLEPQDKDWHGKFNRMNHDGVVKKTRGRAPVLPRVSVAAAQPATDDAEMLEAVEYLEQEQE